MPDWLFWVAFAVLFMSFRASVRCGSGCGTGARRLRGRRDALEEGRRARGSSGSHAQPRLASGGEEWLGRTPPRSQEPARPASRRESPLEVLQRRFVSGSMTLEQYEAELDKLDRLD